MYKTGQKAPKAGHYEFVKYTDGTTTPSPTTQERIISLKKGGFFPPIHSCDKAAWWKDK